VPSCVLLLIERGCYERFKKDTLGVTGSQTNGSKLQGPRRAKKRDGVEKDFTR
jgi:hypothetical protein